MSNYQKMKEKVRQEAIEWQCWQSNLSVLLTYSELATWAHYFEQKTRKYGLLTEFRENGIC